MKLLLTILLTFCAFTASAQSQDEKTYEVYLKEYKFSKKKANKLLIIGGSGIVTGVVLALIPSKQPETDVIPMTGKLLGSIFLITGGTIVSVISVPFFLTAGSHKRKMKKLTPNLGLLKVDNQNFTTIGLKLEF